MPSVLLEIGFMINPDEFTQLIDPQFQTNSQQLLHRIAPRHIACWSINRQITLYEKQQCSAIDVFVLP